MTATPTAVGAAGAVTSTPNDSGGNTGLILIVVVALLLLGGAGTAAGIVVYRMRRASVPAHDGAEASYGYPAGGYGGYGQAGQSGGQGASPDDETYYAPGD